MHCFYQFLLMSSIFTRILSLAHLFYAYFTHGPNKSASAQYDNTRGAWLTQEGCTITERKERKEADNIYITPSPQMSFHLYFLDILISLRGSTHMTLPTAGVLWMTDPGPGAPPRKKNPGYARAKWCNYQDTWAIVISFSADFVVRTLARTVKQTDRETIFHRSQHGDTRWINPKKKSQ